MGQWEKRPDLREKLSRAPGSPEQKGAGEENTRGQRQRVSAARGNKLERSSQEEEDRPGGMEDRARFHSNGMAGSQSCKGDRSGSEWVDSKETKLQKENTRTRRYGKLVSQPREEGSFGRVCAGIHPGVSKPPPQRKAPGRLAVKSDALIKPSSCFGLKILLKYFYLFDSYLARMFSKSDMKGKGKVPIDSGWRCPATLASLL